MESFKDAQYMTAAEKALVARQWKTFLKRLATADTAPTAGADYGYFPATLDAVFTDRLYKFLSCYSGFIAHYNRRGFLSARFHDSADIRKTFSQLRNRNYCGGYFEYADLGAALVRELDGAAAAFEARWARESAAAESLERLELARLQAKYQDGR